MCCSYNHVGQFHCSIQGGTKMAGKLERDLKNIIFDKTGNKHYLEKASI